MKKPVVYGTPICPDCAPIREYLDSKGFEYDYVDITEHIMNLKEFLAIRDARSEFDNIRANKYVGIPVLVMDDKIYFYEEIQELIK
ncbi:MAG: glutaredoxin domain-containing protein [Peptostreptococcaceae bacterium]|nr:glutaredoxin domain-containing protein [Peptostreptococcaceae bacterium]